MSACLGIWSLIMPPSSQNVPVCRAAHGEKAMTPNAVKKFPGGARAGVFRAVAGRPAWGRRDRFSLGAQSRRPRWPCRSNGISVGGPPAPHSSAQFREDYQGTRCEVPLPWKNSPKPLSGDAVKKGSWAGGRQGVEGAGY